MDINHLLLLVENPHYKLSPKQLEELEAYRRSKLRHNPKFKKNTPHMTKHNPKLEMEGER